MSLAETALEVRPGRFGLWPSVWKLLRLRVRIFYNVFKRSKTINKIGTVALWVLALGLMAFLFWISTLLLRFLRSPALAGMVDAAQFIAVIPTIVLTAAFFLTLITNFGVLLQALYLSHDMDFLITSPLPMRSVFVAKLLEGILPNFVFFSAFSLPVLFGLGTSSRFNPLYYPLLVAMLALFALSAAGVASILVMAVVRVVPAKRVAEVLGFLGATLTVLIGQSGNLVRVIDPDRADVGSLLSSFSRLNVPWSPFTWAGRGLIAIGQGNWLPGLGLTGAALLLAGLVFAGTLVLAEQLYYSGWSSMQGGTRKKKVRTPAAVLAEVPGSAAGVRGARQRIAGILPAPLRGLLVKDFLLLRRDPRNYSQLITPLIVGFVLLFSTRGGGRRTEEMLTGLGFRNLETYSLAVLAVFVGWMLMVNLGTLAFTREGRNYWLIKTAPISGAMLLTAKFIVTYLPALVFSLVYLTLAFLLRGQALNWGLFPFCVLVLVFTVAGSSGIAVAFGAAGAKLDWDAANRQQLRGSAGCLVVIAVGGFLLVDLLLFFAPLAAWQLTTGQIPFLAHLVSVILGGGAAVLCVLLPLSAAEKKVKDIGEAG